MREVVYRLHQEDQVAADAVGRVLPSVVLAAQAAHEALSGGGRLIYVGAGTSGRLGMLDAAECPPTFGTDPDQVVAVLAGGPDALVKAVEGAEDDAADGAAQIAALRAGERDLVVGISASATTPFVLGALKAARKAKAKTVLVCCNPAAKDRQAADLLVAPQTGPELIAGSTRLKAGTATKLVLNALSTAAMVALGKVYRGRMVDMRPTNQKLRARALRMVVELTELPEAKAASLLEEAAWSPKLALAMHFTGAGAKTARQKLAKQGLRGLERRRPG